MPVGQAFAIAFGLTFAILLRLRETGPHGHGLETITTASSAA